MIRRRHCMLIEPGVTGEVRFVNKLFDLAAYSTLEAATFCPTAVNAIQPRVTGEVRFVNKLLDLAA